MDRYRISELGIEIKTNSKTLKKNLQQFESSFDYKPNLTLEISDDILLQLMDEYEDYNADVIECEYFTTEYARALFDFNGFPIKAAAVEYDGCAVLFSAPFESDTKVEEYLPGDKLFTVDAPAIRLISDVFYAYGTPFGLYGDKARDVKLPVKSIVFVDKERFSSLKQLDTKQMVQMFLRAVHLSIRNERTKHTLFMLEKVMHRVKFYGVSDLKDAELVLDMVTDN